MTQPTDDDPFCGNWVTPDDVRACDALDGISDEAIIEASEVATYLLWLLSEKRYPGVCEATVRPCPRPWSEFAPPIHSRSWGWDTSWGWSRPWGWCCDSTHSETSCGCGGGPSRLGLGHWPIRSIVSVEIDGSILAADEYDVLDRRWLIRMADDDGNAQFWPVSQRLDRPVGDDETMEVVLTYGTPPPRAGKRAGAHYTAQIARGCADDGSCVLPPRVQSMLRQGVQFTFFDPRALQTDGLVGLPEVDEWLAAERYGQRMQPAAFINPDDYAPAHTLGAPLGS